MDDIKIKIVENCLNELIVLLEIEKNREEKIKKFKDITLISEMLKILYRKRVRGWIV